MSPRRSRDEATATRSAILERAVDVASLEGLEGLTIGRLAGELGMSKAGVIGGFGSKEALQLATLEAALDVFRREVWERVAPEPSGLPRLTALCDAWIDYLERDVFPGGCFVSSASAEFDGREGPVRDALRRALGLWLKVLEAEARAAIDAGDLPAETDARMVAFQLNAIAVGANQSLQLLDDPGTAQRARRAMDAVLRGRA